MRMLVTLRTILGRLGGVRSQDGFTLIEALMAAVILIVGLIGLLGLLDVSVKASAQTRAREGATNLAREILEDAHSIPYGQIVPTSIEGQLQAMNGLANATPGSGWHIKRRGFEYTVAVNECAIDNPKDGIAETHGSTFCAEQPEWKVGDVLDTEPEDLKRITAEVSWTFQKHTATVKQVSTLTAAGQGIGLIATKLEITSPYNTEVSKSTPTTPVITNKETKTLTFSVSFPEATTAVDWSLEGAKQEELAPASKATSLTFSWTINESAQKIYVADGTYQVSAQTVDSSGVIGPPISIPVRLIRGTPTAVKGIVGGFNTVYKSGLVATEAAELQWKANAERNVIGYRVLGPAKELICPSSSETLSTATSCIDFNAGKPAERSYTVVALYRNANEEVTEGPATPPSITIKSSESTPPNPPTFLVATKNANGSVTLTWTASKGGASASFYRIYRGSKEYTSRYGTTSATECVSEICSFTDTDTATTHEYWVTAASSNLVESSFPNPVSG
jgi:hypothetical protein